MLNFATALKSEITQVAQKTLRDEAQQLKKAAATHHREIAALQRRIDSLERLVSGLRAKSHPSARRAGAGARSRKAGKDTEGAAEGPALRFSAKGFGKLRQRLGLSAAAMGALLGVTAQSVYKWEDGKARPRATQLQAIARMRKLGKREAASRLAELESGEPGQERVTH